MKLTTAIATALMITATAASAAPRLIHSNVPLSNGVSADGFKLTGNGVTSFVEAQYADLVSGDVVVLPEGVSAENLDQVTAYLTSIGITGYDVQVRCQGDKAVYNDAGEKIGGFSTAEKCKW